MRCHVPAISLPAALVSRPASRPQAGAACRAAGGRDLKLVTRGGKVRFPTASASDVIPAECLSRPRRRRLRRKTDGSEPCSLPASSGGKCERGGSPLSQEEGIEGSEFAEVRRRRAREFRSPALSAGWSGRGAFVCSGGGDWTRYPAKSPALLARRSRHADGSERVRCPRDWGESVKGGCPPVHKKPESTNRNSPPRAARRAREFRFRCEAPGGPGGGLIGCSGGADGTLCPASRPPPGPLRFGRGSSV